MKQPSSPPRWFRACTAIALLLAGPGTNAASLELIKAPDGVPLCVFETGNPKGNTIVFLHGFSQSHAVFKRQYAGALAKTYRLVGIDLRGHGCSGKPADEVAYATAEIWARDLQAVFTAKHIERPLVVAWSFGAYVVADYVRTFDADRLAGAALVGSTAALLPPDVDPAAKRRRAAAPPPHVESGLELERAIRDASGFARLMSAGPLDADLAAIMSSGTLQLPMYASAVMTKRELRNDDLVARFTLPTLFLVGSQDRANPPELMDRLAGELRAARVVRFPESGHSPFAEDPENFNSAVDAFAREVFRGRR